MDQLDSPQELFEVAPVEHRRFNPYRRPMGVLEEVAQRVVALIEQHEHRKRRRRSDDHRRFVEQVRALVADLAHCWLTTPEGSLDIELSNRVLGVKGRYSSDVMKESLVAVVEALASSDLSLIELTKGYPHPFLPVTVASSIKALPSLLAMFNAAAIELGHIGRVQRGEVIILREERTGASPGAEIDYDDTPETLLMRQQLQGINQWLTEADISTDALQGNGRPYDQLDRSMSRIFNNGTFSEGGRLYGGFWQAMKKDHRKDIRINEQSVVALDFGQMLVRLLYAEAGEGIPFGDDAYLLPPLHMTWQEFNGYTSEQKLKMALISREGIKLVLTAAINFNKDQTRLPAGARDFIPAKYSLERVMELIRTHHQPIVPFLGTGHGLRALRKESDLLIDILLRLKERGIVALPIHDAVIVQSMKEGEVRGIMAQAFREHTGQDPVIKAEW